MNVNQFFIENISDAVFAGMWQKSFKEDCLLPREDLRLLHILHYNLEGETLQGELVCNKHIAEAVLYIFQELYKAHYPIERVELIDKYNGDDELSMTANNSSAFNYRLISYTNRISKHGMGMAVDINPLYNPYVKEVAGKVVVAPVKGDAYVDRAQSFPYKIEADDLCCRLFAEQGFEWGGDFEESKDYQHFQLPLEKIKELYPNY